MSKKTLALVITLFVVTLVLLGVAIRSSRNTAPLSTNLHPSPTPAAHTVLSLSPQPVMLAADGTGTVEVRIDTGTNKVTAVQLELSYNPEILTNVKVTNGTFFTTPLTLINNSDVKSGRVSFALGVTPQEQPMSGTGTVAVVTFSKKLGATAKETRLELLSKSLVTASGIPSSVLRNVQGTTILLNGGMAASPSSYPTRVMRTYNGAPQTSSTGAVTR